LEEAAVSTLAKLDQLLPAHVAGRVRALHESTAQMLWGDERERVDAGVLVALAQACSAQHRVRFDYTDRRGQASSRLVEPLRLVRSGSRWYLVARDIDRRAWRTFRLDRVRQFETVGTHFEVVDPPDPVAMVTEGLTVRSYPFQARIRVPLPLEEATRLLPRTYAVFEGGDDRCSTVVDLGSTSPERMVAYLAGLTPPCQVLDPPELREALRQHAAGVAAANGGAAG
jgi:predicted DNA-binding transcriptional regulator YafY